MHPFLLSCFLALLSVSLASGDQDAKVHPIVLVPGTYGSQMEARLDKASVVHDFCTRKSSWFTIFLNPFRYAGDGIDCFVDNFQLVFNNETGRSDNSPGVETRVLGFGSTQTIEYLAEFEGNSDYLHELVQELLTIGYRSGDTLLGAPYDFRRAPDENQEFLDAVQLMIEQVYESKNKTRVILMSHSTGSRLTYYFLRQMSQAWKDKYVRAFISIAGSFGGQTGSLVALTSGQYDSPFSFPQQQSIRLHRSFPSFLFEAPQALAFKDLVIFERDNVSYTAGNMSQILAMIGHETGLQMLPKLDKLIPDLGEPGVPVTCVRGRGVPTWEKVSYRTDSDFPLQPELVRGDGDGIVNKVSADVCLSWADAFGFREREFSGIKHLQMVTDPDVLAYVGDRVLEINRDLNPDEGDIIY